MKPFTRLRPGNSAQPLQPAPRDELGNGPLTFRFTIDAAGAVSRFTLSVGRIRNLRIDRIDAVAVPR